MPKKNTATNQLLTHQTAHLVTELGQWKKVADDLAMARTSDEMLAAYDAWRALREIEE